MTKLGPYWSVSHRRPQDYDFFRRLQPSVIKVMDGGDVDYKWISENLPNSLVVARIHALSEQHDDMLRDPVGTGKRHAQEWNSHAHRLGFDRAKTFVLGINEPHVWEAGVPEALRRYTIAMCDEAARLFLRVGAMQLGVGWPNNRGPDTPPDWTPWHGVEAAIRLNNGALITHEYWADAGPGENWGWWAGRTLKCPWNVPIIIGECGIDMFVKSAQFQGSRGWNGQVDADRYARELAEYVGRMSVDSRFVGCTVFASDYANREWFSFDIEPAYQTILRTPIPVYPPVKPPSVPVMYVHATAGANLRSQPIDGGILIAVPYGEAVQVHEEHGSWSRVTYREYTGWMLTLLLGHEVPGPIVVTPPVVQPPPMPPPSPPTQGIIEPRVAQAILKIESGGRTHGEDGRIIIRFEAHVFKTYLGNDALWAQHFRTDATRGWVDQMWRRTPNDAWQPIHTGKQADEWAAFEFANALNAWSSFMSISMGAAQIVGFNHARIGYSTAAQMFSAFQNAQMQIVGFINFFLSNPALIDAARRKDWREIARLYNGSGAVDTYAPLLERAYRELGG